MINVWKTSYPVYPLHPCKKNIFKTRITRIASPPASLQDENSDKFFEIFSGDYEYDDNRFTLSGEKQAFLRYEERPNPTPSPTPVPDIWKSNLSATSQTDTWDTPSEVVTGCIDPAVTYRAFGTEKVFYVKYIDENDDEIYDAEDGLFEQAYGDVSLPKLTTIRPINTTINDDHSKDNIFMVHKYIDASDDHNLDVYHILP